METDMLVEEQDGEMKDLAVQGQGSYPWIVALLMRGGGSTLRR